MKSVLSFIKARRWPLLLLLGILVMNVAFAFQDAPPPLNVNTGFDAILLIPLALGILAHYLKSYSRGQTTLNLWQYLVQGIGLTFTTIIAAAASLIGMQALNPAAYSPINFNVLFTVFLLGFSWDSATGGTSIKSTPTVAAAKTP